MPVFLMRAILPDDEYYQWMTYLRYKKPTINEIQLANVSALIVQAVGGKAKVSDFLISDNKPITTTTQGVKDGAFKSFATVAEDFKAAE